MELDVSTTFPTSLRNSSDLRSYKFSSYSGTHQPVLSYEEHVLIGTYFLFTWYQTSLDVLCERNKECMPSDLKAYCHLLNKKLIFLFLPV